MGLFFKTVCLVRVFFFFDVISNNKLGSPAIILLIDFDDVISVYFLSVLWRFRRAPNRANKRIPRSLRDYFFLLSFFLFWRLRVSFGFCMTHSRRIDDTWRLWRSRCEENSHRFGRWNVVANFWHSVKDLRGIESAVVYFGRVIPFWNDITMLFSSKKGRVLQISKNFEKN